SVRSMGMRKKEWDGVWYEKKKSHVKARFLAFSVRSQEPDNLPGAHMQVNSVHYRAAAVNFDQLIGGQNGLCLRCDGRTNFGSRSGRGLTNHGLGRDGAGEVWAAGVWD